MVRTALRAQLGKLAAGGPLTPEAGFGQRLLRFAVEFARSGAHQLRRDRSTHMAASLAFRTLFGLLPVLVVGTVLVNSLVGMDQFLASVDDLFQFVGLNDVHIIPPTPTATQGQADPIMLSNWLKELLDQAAAINLSAIGWVGLAVVVYAALSLLGTIENCFNVVYRAPSGRAWGRRIPVYWLVLTASPLAVAVSMFVNEQFANWIESVETWQGVLGGLRIAWSIAFTGLFMFAIYALLPNTSVSPKSAACGALIAALLLEVGKRSMGAYVENAFAISHLYGSLGLIPLFMYWVYLMWLVVLFGLQVSATLQFLPERPAELGQGDPLAERLLDSTIVLQAMELVGQRFLAGQPTHVSEICRHTSLAEPLATEMLDKLARQGTLHWLDDTHQRVTLAKPPAQIRVMQLLEAASGSPRGTSSRFVDRLREHQRSLAARTTLETLLDDQSRGADGAWDASWSAWSAGIRPAA